MVLLIMYEFYYLPQVIRTRYTIMTYVNAGSEGQKGVVSLNQALESKAALERFSSSCSVTVLQGSDVYFRIRPLIFISGPTHEEVMRCRGELLRQAFR